MEPKNIPISDKEDPKLKEARHAWVRLRIKYDYIMNYLHRDKIEENGQVWQFRKIICHQGSLKRSDHDCNGSLYNIQVEWENGEITYVPLNLMIKDDKVTMA